METPLPNFKALSEYLSSREKKTLVIAGATGSEVLNFCELAQDICRFILIGETEKFKACPLPPESYRFIAADDSKTQSRLAVEEVAAGRGDLLMKGSVKTGDLMKAALSKEFGLGRDRLLTHILALEKPQGGFWLITDGGMVIEPALEEKCGIIDNAVEAARGLGVDVPKIWLNFLSENAACDAGQIDIMARDGRWGAVEILASRDPDYFPSDFDIVVAPGLEGGNITGKGLMYLGRLTGGLMVAGAKVPIVVTSRVDNAITRFNSLALCLFLSGNRE